MQEIPEMVCWHEGMALLPQHFQLQSLRADTVAATLVGSAYPLFWGVSRLSINASAFSDGLLQVTELEAIMPDGTPIRVRAGIDKPLQLDLRELSEAIVQETATVVVSMAPLFRAGRLESISGRFVSATSEPIPDLSVGENPVCVPTWRAQLQLGLDRLLPSAITLPLLRFRRQNGAHILVAYEPPTAILSPQSSIGRQLAALCTSLRSKCVFLAARLRNAQRIADTRTEQSLVVLLGGLWNRLPELEVVLLSGVSHPAVVYAQLAGLGGALCTLDPGSGMTTFRPYDHRDLLACFEHGIELVREKLDGVRQDYQLLDFSHDENGYAVALPEGPATAFHYVAVFMPTSSDAGAGQRWMSECLIASESCHPALIRQRMLGLPRRVLERKEAVRFSMGEGVEIFAIAGDDSWIRRGEPLRITGSKNAAIEPWRLSLLIPDRQDDNSGGETSHA